MNELDQTAKLNQTTILSLEEKLKAARQPNSATIQQTEQLKVSYQNAIKQASDLQLKVQRLTGENKNYVAEIANLNAAKDRATNSMSLEGNQTQLTQKNQELTTDNQALEQKNQQLNKGYAELERKYQDLSQQQRLAIDDNQTLNDRITELKSANSDFDAGDVSNVASIDAGVTAPITAESQPSVDATAFEAKISQLTRKNRQLSDANSDFKNKNQLLNRRLTDLNNKDGSFAVNKNSPATVATALPNSLPTAVSSTAVSGSKRGWGILTWLIPFLAIGLAVAFFVIIKEELHRPSPGAANPARKD